MPKTQIVEVCKSCGARIMWLYTKRHKRIPVDLGSISEGEREFNYLKHRVHFKTCPNAGEWRKK